MLERTQTVEKKVVHTLSSLQSSLGVAADIQQNMVNNCLFLCAFFQNKKEQFPVIQIGQTIELREILQ